MTLPAYLETPSYEYKLDKLRSGGKGILPGYYSADGIVRFAQEILGITLKPYQERILRHFFERKRLAVQSLHGVGKTAVAAVIILWSMTCIPGEVKVVTTASRWLQLIQYLWPEVHKWGRRVDWSQHDIDLQMLDRNLRVGYNRRAFATSPDMPEGIEGAHAETVVYVFDEAKSIPDNLFDSVEGAFANAGEDTEYEAFALAISTPGIASGRFHDICKQRPGYRDWATDRITLDEALAAGQVSLTWVENRQAAWGEDSAIYKNRVLGEFAQEGERSLYKMAWIEAAVDRWRACEGQGDKGEMLRYASDVADDGRDHSTIARMRGWVVEDLRYMNCDPVELADRIMKEVGPVTRWEIGVDANGVGAGTYARLKQKRYRAVKIKGSYRTDETDITGENKFKNLRAMMAWRLRELLDPNSLAHKPLALPPDERLERELLVHDWEETNGVIRISDKEKDLRTQLDGRSPDGADTIMMLAYLATKKRRATIQRI